MVELPERRCYWTSVACRCWQQDACLRVQPGVKYSTTALLDTMLLFVSLPGSADQALDRFAMKRFYEDKVLPVGQPSQKRSVVAHFVFMGVEASSTAAAPAAPDAATRCWLSSGRGVSSAVYRGQSLMLLLFSARHICVTHATKMNVTASASQMFSPR